MSRQLRLASAGEQRAQMPEPDKMQAPLVVFWHRSRLVFELCHRFAWFFYISSRANDSQLVTVIDGVVPPMTTRHRKYL
jgi:hypothetical protein